MAAATPAPVYAPLDMADAQLAGWVELACTELLLEASCASASAPSAGPDDPHATPAQCQRLLDLFPSARALASSPPFAALGRAELCRLLLGRARARDPRRFPVRVDCTGHADALLLVSHARLGQHSPLAEVPGDLLRELCRAAAEAVVVVDGPCTRFGNGDGGDGDDDGVVGWSTLPPTSAGTSGAPPERWRWRTGPRHAATAGEGATVSGSAAAQWQAGRVLVCGGLLSRSSGEAPFAPSRLYDVACARWADCGVPTLELLFPVAVSHDGDYYVLGGTDAGLRDHQQLTVLAREGSEWVDCGPRLPGALTAACSLAGSIWATANVGDYDGADGKTTALLRCDPREPRCDRVEAAGLRDVPLMGASIAGCGGVVYSVGGMREDNEGSGRRCQKLDARMPRAWQDVAPLAQGRGWCGLACLEGRQCLVALGGQNKVQVSTRGICEYASVELYVPCADRWYRVADLPDCCGNAASLTVAVRMFA
eukprot:m51a1_g10704 hypothetical protein (482) ;mRNA; f:161420-162865